MLQNYEHLRLITHIVPEYYTRIKFFYVMLDNEKYKNLRYVIKEVERLNLLDYHVYNISFTNPDSQISK